MGNARARGTRDERKAQAIAAGRVKLAPARKASKPTAIERLVEASLAKGTR